MQIWAHLCISIIAIDILTHGKGPTLGLNDGTFNVEAEYSINFTE